MVEHPAYELEGLRANGETFTVEVLGHLPEADAIGLAQEYADRWQATVNLNRVPFIHTGSAAWGPDQMHLVQQFMPARQIRE